MDRFTKPQPTGKYLDARIATASQPELQLMLLDGAIRFGRQALTLLGEEHRIVAADALLARALDIVEELVHSVTEGQSETAQRLEEEYAFAFRELAAARINRNATALERVLKLLSYQRETWQLACEKLKAASPTVAPTPKVKGPHFAVPPLGGISDGSIGLSLQA